MGNLGSLQTNPIILVDRIAAIEKAVLADEVSLLSLQVPFVTQGKIFHVKPSSGSNSTGDGLTAATALKTLTAALSLCTAGENDTVLLYSESNTAANTTDYQTSTLVWNKDLVHLIGVGAGGAYNKRSRVGWSSAATSATAVPLFTLSANACLIAGVSFSVGSAIANLSYGVNVTGINNRFVNVDVAWPTNTANDVAGAYALNLAPATQCLFQKCTFGSFTIDTGSAANQIVLVSGGASMVKFEDCDFISRISSSTNSPAVRLTDANTLGFGDMWFKRCNFIADSVNGAYTQTGAFATTAAQTGRIILIDCHMNGTRWDASSNSMILNGCAPIPIGATAGLTYAS